MGMSTYCCLNPLPPSPSHDLVLTPSLPSKTSLVSRKIDDERSRRKNKNVMATIACTIVISLEMGDLVSNNMNNEGNYSMASEMTMETKFPNKNNKRKVQRWSDKRICPPWNMNSLETIVPENLPRPSFAKRKWEGVSNTDIKTAPQVKFLVSTRTGCFTM